METIFGFLIFDVLFSAIGWVCLFVWYRDRKKMKEVRDEKYAGHYGAAGKIFMLNFIAGLGAITMIGLVVTMICVLIYKAIADVVR